MQRVLWTAWAVVFALAFLLIFVTHFGDAYAMAWAALLAVGCLACMKVARADSARRERR